MDEDRKKLEDEPLAEADGVDCDIPANEAEIGPTDREGTATESEASLREEIFEAFTPVTTVMVESPVDGMPIPANERFDLAVAHPFTRDTVVCVEDDTEFVELFAEELESRGWVKRSRGWFRKTHSFQTTSSLGGAIEVVPRSAFDESGNRRDRASFKPEDVKEKHGVFVSGSDHGMVPVRMKRERCQHFMRQVMANDDVPDPREPGHLLRFYNCAARRSVGGALMSLRDEAVYACDYRSPRDPSTQEKHLDKFDRDRLNSKRHLELIRPFNLAD